MPEARRADACATVTLNNGVGSPREELFVTTKVRTGEPGLVYETLQRG